jgi:hypothetical protein
MMLPFNPPRRHHDPVAHQAVPPRTSLAAGIMQLTNGSEANLEAKGGVGRHFDRCILWPVLLLATCE